jgi:hypothetical protein
VTHCGEVVYGKGVRRFKKDGDARVKRIPVTLLMTGSTTDLRYTRKAKICRYHEIL